MERQKKPMRETTHLEKKRREAEILQKGDNRNFTHRFSILFLVPVEAPRPSSCLNSKLLITLSFLLKSA